MLGMNLLLPLFIAGLVGLLLGALVAGLWSHSRSAGRIASLEAERSAALDRVSYAERSQEQLSGQFRALSAEALADNSNRFLALADARVQATEHVVAPLRDTLDKVALRLREIEQTRVSTQASLSQQIELVRTTGEDLRRETTALGTALRRPEVRGRWGEMHLRRAVELAGMVERCDFEVQATTVGDDGATRPDMIVHLAGDKHVIVDSKVPLSAFLDAAASDEASVRAERLRAHARQLRVHVDQLSAKAYWQRLPSTPEFVVLFVPGEAFLAQALDVDPSLLEYAAARKVVLSTPTTLIALLRTVAYAWTQEALADNAREVFELARELHTRLGGLGDHVDKLGRALSGAVTAYNKTVGSLETRVLVTARRLRDLDVVETDLASPRSIGENPRPLAAPELVTTAAEAAIVRPLRPQEQVSG